MTAALTIGCRQHLGLGGEDFELTTQAQGEILERDAPSEALPLLRQRPDIAVLIACLDSADQSALRLMRIVRRRYPSITAVALFDARPLESLRETARTLVQVHLCAQGQDGAETPPEANEAPAQRDKPADLGYYLTGRQMEVLYFIRAGLSNKQIARVLKLSEGTVKIHCMAVFRELEVDNRTQAALFAERLDLAEPESYRGAPTMGSMRRAVRTPSQVPELADAPGTLSSE